MKPDCIRKLPLVGGKRWRFKYRILGKEKLISLGTYPDVTLKKSREKRDQARKLIAKGKDPSEVKQTQRQQAKLHQHSFSQSQCVGEGFTHFNFT